VRTTVELSDRTYTRLRAAAAERGNRGLSPIVEEAVSLYLDGAQERAEIARDIEAARGAWSDDDIKELEQALKSAWSAGWQIDRSQTRTSWSISGWGRPGEERGRDPQPRSFRTRRRAPGRASGGLAARSGLTRRVAPRQPCPPRHPCQPRQASMRAAITGPVGGSDRYWWYFAPRSSSACSRSVPSSSTCAAPSSRTHQSRDQSSS
jgi:hypothetical protein